MDDTTHDEFELRDLHARVTRLTKEFAERHPARVELKKFIAGLVGANRLRRDAPPRDRERGRVAHDLDGYNSMLVDLLGEVFEIIEAPIIEERTFDLIHRVIHTAVTLGRLSAPPPEGSSGQDAQKESAAAKFIALTQAVIIYHKDGVELKVTPDYAKVMRPAMLDAFGLPEDSGPRVWPTVSAITRALSAVHNRTLKR